MARYNAGSQRPRQRNIMRAFKIDEISAVDRPAQVGARAVIMKRDDGSNPQTGDAVEKRAWLTTDVDGHAHLVDDRNYDNVRRDGGDTSWSVSASAEEGQGHSHPWIANMDGSITIGASEGHTHTVLETTLKSTEAVVDGGTKEEDDTMPKTTEQEAAEKEAAKVLKAATDRSAELETQLVEANARAEMTDVEKVHLDGLDPSLDDDARKVFVAAKSAQRAEIVAKAIRAAEDAKGIAYTADDGTEYTKSDDPRLVSQAKRNDELAKRLEDTTKRADTQDLRKRAEEDLKHLPGTVETRMALLKAVESIGDADERKVALEALKAQNEQMAEAFKTKGSTRVGGTVQTGTDEDSAEGQLDTLAKRYATDNKVTEAEGYDAVLKTVEGAALYGEFTGDSQYIN